MANIERIRGSNGNGEAVRAIVTAARSAGAISLQVGNPVNFPNEFIGTWGTLNQATGLLNPGSIRVFYGKLNGSNIDIEGMAPGYTDDGNQVGDVVLLKPNTAWADELAEVLQTSLNDDGTLKDGIVTTDKINNSAVTTAKLGDSQVTTAKLANKSVTSAKVDFGTFDPMRKNTGSDGSKAPNATIASISNYPFKANMLYLIIVNAQQFTPGAAGEIWEGRVRVGGSTIDRTRVGGVPTQTYLSSTTIYKPSTTSNQTIDVQAGRLSGTNNIMVEAPTLTVLPVIAS